MAPPARTPGFRDGTGSAVFRVEAERAGGERGGWCRGGEIFCANWWQSVFSVAFLRCRTALARGGDQGSAAERRSSTTSRYTGFAGIRRGLAQRSGGVAARSRPQRACSTPPAGLGRCSGPVVFFESSAALHASSEECRRRPGADRFIADREPRYSRRSAGPLKARRHPERSLRTHRPHAGARKFSSGAFCRERRVCTPVGRRASKAASAARTARGLR